MLGSGRIGILETMTMLLNVINRKDRARQVVSFCPRMPFFLRLKKASTLKGCTRVPVLADLLLPWVRVGGGYGGSFGQAGHCGVGGKKMFMWKVQVGHNCCVPSASESPKESSVRPTPHRAVLGSGFV